jgi:hypothetical protein
MLFIRGLAGFLLLALWIYCIVDVVTRDKSEHRNLPKLAWLAVVFFLGVIGSVLWLVAGRPRTSTEPAGEIGFPDASPGRAGPNPDDDEDFLRGLRQRVREQRQAEERRAAEERERAAKDQEADPDL